MIGWTTSLFVIGTEDGPVKVLGLVKNGLAIDERGVVDGEMTWALTHVGTGLRIVNLRGNLKEVLEPADDIATQADWTFTTIDQAKTGPFKAVVIAIAEDYPGIVYRGSGRVGNQRMVDRVHEATRRA